MTEEVEGKLERRKEWGPDLCQCSDGGFKVVELIGVVEGGHWRKVLLELVEISEESGGGGLIGYEPGEEVWCFYGQRVMYAAE